MTVRYVVLLIALTACACTVTSDFSMDLPGSSGGPELQKSAAVVAPDIQLPAYERVVLENGLELLLMERHEVPLVGVEVLIRGGAVADPEGAAGTGALLAQWLQKGAGNRNAQQFAAAVEGVGGELYATGGVESLQVSGEFVARDSDLMIELLADMLIRPRLDDEEFAKLRERNVQLLRAAKDSDPRALISTYGAAWLFQDHPYGSAVGGSEASLERITPELAGRYYRDHVGADRTVIAVAGDFDSAQMERQLRSALGEWRRAAAPVPVVPAARPERGRRVLMVDKPGATQTYFWLGNVGVARGFEHRAALNLGNTVFGGRFTSMLNTELRVKSGLTYGAASRLSQPSQPGYVAIASYTQTVSTGEAIDLALATLDRFRQHGLDEAALMSAKAYSLGQFPLSFETSGQLAAQLATLRFYGLEDDYVNAYPQQIVAADQSRVHEVIQRVFPASDSLVMVLIGDAAALADTPSRYGEVTRVELKASEYLP